MRTLCKLGTGLLLAVGFAIATPTLADTAVTVEHGKHHYVYYADHQIYYAPDTKVYYWRNGDRWTSGNELPPEDRAYVTTGGFQIDLDTDKPYERHEWVLSHYRDHEHEHDH